MDCCCCWSLLWLLPLLLLDSPTVFVNVVEVDDSPVDNFEFSSTFFLFVFLVLTLSLDFASSFSLVFRLFDDDDDEEEANKMDTPPLPPMLFFFIFCRCDQLKLDIWLWNGPLIVLFDRLTLPPLPLCVTFAFDPLLSAVDKVKEEEDVTGFSTGGSVGSVRLTNLVILVLLVFLTIFV